MSTMSLDGLLRHSKLTANLLIEHASGNELHHLVLARREPFEQAAGMKLLRCATPLFGRGSESAFDAFQQLSGLERLWEKIDGACFHCLGAHRNIAVSGDKNELFFALVFDQNILKIDAIEAGHLHIDNDTRRSRMRCTQQKFRSRPEHFGFVMGSV